MRTFTKRRAWACRVSLLVAVATVAALGLFLGSPATATAAILSTGIMFTGPGPNTIANTLCIITNVGTRDAQVISVGILSSINDPPFAATFDSCTGPLSPGATCTFGAFTGVYGGGIAEVTRPNELRGSCFMIDLDTGTTVQAAAMR